MLNYLETKTPKNIFLQYALWILRVILSSLERFYWDNGFSKAASLAYTSLISLVPVTFVVFGFLASFAVGNQEIINAREFIFRQLVPNQQAVDIILSKITEIQTALNSSNFSILAVAFFALTALLLINSIEYALNEVWQVFESRSIAQRMTIFCAILVVGPILILSTYYTTKLRLEPFLSGLEILQDVSISINHILSVLLDSLALFALYYLVPKAPVRITPAIFGSLIAAVLFETAKFFFTSYIVQFTSYDKIYGALSIIPIFLFWLYITWSIVLFGAQCSFQFQHLPRNGKMWKKQITSVGDATIVLAIQVLVIISKAFKNGDKPLNEFEIADKLGTSSIVINPIIENLKKCQIVARSDSREMPLMLLVNPEKISLFDILEKNEFRLYDSDSLSKVGAFLQNLSQNSSSEPSKDAVLSKNIKEIHLSDLI